MLSEAKHLSVSTDGEILHYVQNDIVSEWYVATKITTHLIVSPIKQSAPISPIKRSDPIDPINPINPPAIGRVVLRTTTSPSLFSVAI